MSIRVFKFGGSSVGDLERIAHVKGLIASFLDDNLVVVISAMGKTTNALELVYEKYLKSEDEGLKELDIVFDQHMEIVKGLGLNEKELQRKLEALMIDNLSFIPTVSNSDAIYDQIISLGELFSTTIISEYLKGEGLKAKWMDVRHVITTDDNYKEGKVDFGITRNKISKKVKKYLSDSDIVITQGFIGRGESGLTTTLGREGSDYSAAIFAYALDVEELTIWKDVPGILTADPRRFDNVELLDKVSYREAIEMTYYGAKVIHPKTIQPIQNKSIKLKVRSFINTDSTGTLITESGMPSYPPIVVIQDEVILLQITSKDFSFISEEHLSIIFSQMAELKIKSSVMRNSAISFTLCINQVSDKKLDTFIKVLGNAFDIETYKGLQLITIRHFQPSVVEELTQNKVVLFEEKLKDTIQLVVRPAPTLKEKQLPS